MALAGVTGSRAAEIANLATRQAKDKEATPENLQSEWRERAAKFGITPEAIAAARATHSVDGKAPSDGERVMQVATENTAVARAQDIAYCAAVIAQEGGGAKEAERLLSGAKATAIELKKEVTYEIETENGTRVKSVEKTGYTTPEIQRSEKSVADWAERNAGAGNHAVESKSAITRVEQQQGYKLNAEQRQAVETLARSGSAAAMVGDAGTGKSTTLNAVREAYQSAGYKVIGTAPSAKAAAELEKSAGITSTTIDRFNLRHSVSEIEVPKFGDPSARLDEKTVVVVDEAGMADVRQIQKLTEAAERAGAKIVLVGDHKQLQPVGAGAPFRSVVERVETARLQEIHRQRDTGDRQAVRDLAQGKAAEGLGHYIAKGQVTVAQTHAKAMKEIAAKTVEAIDRHGAQRAVALASTNKAVADINQVVRAQLKARGELQGGREYNCLREAGTDKWDKTERRHHEKGEFAPGDRVVHSGRNDRRGALNRSDTGTVVSVSEKTVAVKMDKDGSLREIQPERQDLRHGYALTTHKAQGMTVERAVVYIQGQNLSREMAYVQASRAKGETEFVTTKTQVEKLARDAPPSRETTALVQAIEQARLERGQGPALRPEHTETAAGAVEYLQQHAPGSISHGGKTAAEVDLATLTEAARGMAESKQAESTLDWQGVRGGDNEPELERDPQQSVEVALEQDEYDYC